MAIGNFANLGSYRRQVDAQKLANLNPLENLINNYTQGAEQGNILVNLPGLIQQENQLRNNRALSNQLALELQKLNLDQERNKIAEQQNPLLQAIKEATQRKAASDLGIILPSQVQGQTAIQALPVSDEVQRVLALTDDNAPLQEEVVSSTRAPVQLSTGAIYDPETALYNQQQAALRDFRNKQMLERTKPINISPDATSILERDPITGEPTKTFQAPGKKSEDKLINVPPGTKVIDKTGKEIFRNDISSPSDKPIILPKGAKLVDKNGKTISENAGPAAPNVASEYRSERKRRILSDIEGIRKKVGPNTVGLGSLLTKIPGTEASDLEADIDSLSANIAFNELQEMRNASKTGGALGQVAVKELELLQSALGSLKQRQSDKNFLKNLKTIEDSVKRWEEASAQISQGPSKALSTGLIIEEVPE